MYIGFHIKSIAEHMFTMVMRVLLNNAANIPSQDM